MPQLDYNIDLCVRLSQDAPPLVPAEIRENLRKAIEQMQNNMSLSVDEVENVIIFFGKQLWPYREAYKEFYNVYEGMLGEKFFLRKVSVQVKVKYNQYVEQGGSYKELHRGARMDFFTYEERPQISMALVDVEQDIENYTRQNVVSTDQRKYEQRVREFQQILENIEGHLSILREMSEKEGEHPELVAEIEAQIKGFEHGLCLLGPKTDYEEIRNAREHFEGRRKVIALHKTVM